MIIQIQNILQESKNTIEKTIKSEQITKNLNAVVEIIFNAFSEGNKILLCGNGGSAGNANHLANDLTFGSTYPHEIGISVESLASNASVLTCLANDLGYEYVFSHQLKVKASKGDVLLAFSGSGNSSNIVEALKTAKQMGVLSFCFLDKN